jgi:hypothetical protein
MNADEQPSEEAMRNAARVFLRAAIRIEQDRIDAEDLR